MEFRNYIENGERKAGKQTELAKILGISDAYIRAAKRGNRGLPDAICIRLADYINEERLEVIAASNLVTEKDEEKRKVFESCFTKQKTSIRENAAKMMIGGIIASMLAFSPLETVEAKNVINQESMYIMLNIIDVEHIEGRQITSLI